MSFLSAFFNFLTGEYYIETGFQLFLSVLLSGLIGFERRARSKPVGSRTCIIITTSATLFTILSIHGFAPFVEGSADPARLAAQILGGIGFIGAGVIFKSSSKDEVKGITTAATIWALTGVGIAIGVSQYFLALLVSGVLIGVLWAPKSMHEKIKPNS